MARWRLRDDPLWEPSGMKSMLANITGGCHTDLTQGTHRWRRDKVLAALTDILEQAGRRQEQPRGPHATAVQFITICCKKDRGQHPPDSVRVGNERGPGEEISFSTNRPSIREARCGHLVRNMQRKSSWWNSLSHERGDVEISGVQR